MKDAFNALSFAGKEAVQRWAILGFLIGTTRGPDSSTFFHIMSGG
jgi:hypothetical protein